MTQPAAGLKATPLNAAHRKMGARMVDFGGWDMPVQYSGILEEHHAVRKTVGLFDVSHMGEIEIRGPDAFALTDYVTTNAVAKLKIGQAQYSGLLYEHGGFVDDILVHKVADDHYFLCVNASNQEKDFEHIAAAQSASNATVDFASDRYAQLAIQGPKALRHVAKADCRRSRSPSSTTVHRRRGLRHSGPHRPHRLHRRGRLRDLHRARRSRANLE